MLRNGNAGVYCVGNHYQHIWRLVCVVVSDDVFVAASYSGNRPCNSSLRVVPLGHAIGKQLKEINKGEKVRDGRCER